MKKLLLIIVGILLVVWLIGKCSDQTKPSGGTPAASSSSPVRQTPVPEVKAPNWKYESEVDRMDNAVTYWAINESKDILVFDSPYDGGATINLTVRNRRNKLDILFMVSKGQFQTYNRYARLKFDNNKPINVGLIDAADGSSTYVFVENPALVLSRLKKSKTLLAELPFYQEGSRQITFNLEGLEWNIK